MFPHFLLQTECGGKSGEGFYEAQSPVGKFGSSLGLQHLGACGPKPPVTVLQNETGFPVSGPVDKPSSSHINFLAGLG